MHPVFMLLVIIFAFLLWVALSMFFPKIGDVILDMYDDVKRSLEKKE